MDNNFIQFTNTLGITFKIYYFSSVEDTVNINNFNLIVNDIYENTYKYNGNLFKDMVIEIWDTKRPDIPKTKTVCNSNLCYQELGIGNYGGLTSYWKNLIQLNNNVLKSLSNMSNALSHEVGHYKAGKSGFDDLNNPLRIQYDKMRSIHVTPDTSIGEMIAEDIRLFEGGREAKGITRTDKYNYVQGNKVQGLRDLIKIFKPATDIIKTANTFYSKADNIKFGFSDTDFDYIEMLFYVSFPFLPFLNVWRKINRYGFFNYEIVAKNLNGTNKYDWVQKSTF